MMFVDRPVGIDLGTTNSEIAILDPSERDLLVYADRFGRHTMPSAVAWDPAEEELLVGRPARNRRGKQPPPVESIKRRMGQPGAVSVGPLELKPEEVSAKILAELRRAMREHLQSGAPDDIEVRVDRAVVTVPAYFDAPQVEATRRAGELAGLQMLGVLQEPTAAAIYHTWKEGLGDGTFLVYDLGGGTFDVSILRCLGGEYQVLALDGDNYLGGDDFDRRFAERLRRGLVTRGYALDLDVQNDPADAERFQRLVHLAQEIKESLSTREVLSVAKIDFMEDKNGEPVTFESEVGRGEYEAIVADLVGTTLTCCERALTRSQETASVGPADIDHVVLVGGSTRVPAVIRAATEKLCAPAGIEAPLQDEVDTCVALGAAVHAAQLGGLRLGSRPQGEGSPVARVLFRSPFVSKSESAKLVLEVEEAPDGTVAVAIADGGGPLVQEPVDEVPSGRIRLDVPLGQQSEQRVRVQLLSASDQPLAELPFALYRGDLKPRASALSKPTVVAKDIAVEVLKAGRRERKVLIARGTGLPTEAEHRFFTADKSGAVVLRILQNRLPIKTLVLTVADDVPIGTPVDLRLSCDDAMRMEARAVIAGQELWAEIEPAQLEVPASAEAIEALLGEAETIGRALWGHESTAYRRELEPLATGLREVLGTDPAKAAALSARLHRLVEEFRDGTSEGLAPPMHRFAGILDHLRRVVYRAEGPMLGMDTSGWEQRIQDVEERGQQAWDDGDAARWKRVYNEAQALSETASEQEFASKPLDDPQLLQRRLVNLVMWSRQVEQALQDFVPSSAEEVRELQVGERDRLLAGLREHVSLPLGSIAEDSPAATLRRTLDRASSELERIEHAIERLPRIGLVTERSG